MMLAYSRTVWVQSIVGFVGSDDSGFPIMFMRAAADSGVNKDVVIGLKNKYDMYI